MTGTLFVVYMMWVLATMEPDWFILRTTGIPLQRIPTLMAPVLAIIAINRWKAESLYWPFILFTLMHVYASLFAENRTFAIDATQFLVHMLLLWAVTMAVIDTPRKAAVLLYIYLISFVWFGLQGLPAGLVFWHPLLANEDSYGPLMGLGIGFAYYFAAGSHTKKWKWLGYGLCVVCLAGVVASFARGAVLSAGLVLLLVWLRSPRKVVTLFAGLAAAIIVLASIEIFFPAGEFYAEMETIGDGAESGTGRQRWELWGMAVTVFEDSPIFGVGVRNFGVVASRIVVPDPDSYYSNIGRVYAVALHNIYMQVLCEEGIVGVILFVTMFVHFAKNLLFIRSKAAQVAWRREAPDAPDIRSISIGLELAMVAYLANGFFYNQLYIHWQWTLLMLAMVLRYVVEGAVHRGRAATPAAPMKGGEAAAAAKPPNPTPKAARDGGGLSSLLGPTRHRRGRDD